MGEVSVLADWAAVQSFVRRRFAVVREEGEWLGLVWRFDGREHRQILQRVDRHWLRATVIVGAGIDPTRALEWNAYSRAGAVARREGEWLVTGTIAFAGLTGALLHEHLEAIGRGADELSRGPAPSQPNNSDALAHYAE